MDLANLLGLCYAQVPVAAINAVLGTDLPAAQVREFITRICTYLSTHNAGGGHS